MNKKAFTLIELLVVVAIIGILAAVGVVAYNGYTASAKKSATKTNNASVCKWVNAERSKCQIGIDDILNGKITCGTISSKMSSGGNPCGDIGRAIEAALEGKYKNPYGANYAGFGDEGVKAGGWGNDRDLGYTLIDYGQNADKTCNIMVSTCRELPCSGRKWDMGNKNISYCLIKWYP